MLLDGSNKLLMVLMDASVVQVDLETHSIKEVLSVSTYRQTKSKMRFYDRVVQLIHYNKDANHIILVFANP